MEKQEIHAELWWGNVPKGSRAEDRE